MRLPTDKQWEKLYDVFGAREFFDMISSPNVQNSILVLKIVFILFGAFFLAMLIYFYVNSSYLRFMFMQDFSEFFSWQAYGLRAVNKRWKGIYKKAAGGTEKDYKLALIEADDYLYEELQDGEFKGSNFEQMVQNAGQRLMPNFKEVLKAHSVRNMVVRDVNYKLDVNEAKKMLQEYEKALNSIYSF